MSRLNIVEPTLVVAAGSMEGALRGMCITYFHMSQLFGDAASAVESVSLSRHIVNERSCPKCGARMKIWKCKCSDSMVVRNTVHSVETVIMSMLDDDIMSLQWSCMKTVFNDDGDGGRVQKRGRFHAGSCRFGAEVLSKSRACR